jgi:hypothetical protein
MRAVVIGKPRIAGMVVAGSLDMAAVMALVFLFAVASVGLMLKIALCNLSVVTILAMGCFAALAAGVFVGTFLQAKRWENEA